MRLRRTLFAGAPDSSDLNCDEAVLELQVALAAIVALASWNEVLFAEHVECRRKYAAFD